MTLTIKFSSLSSIKPMMLHLTRSNLFVAVDPRLYSVLAIKELPWKHPRLFLLYVSADGCPMTHIKWRQNGPVYWFSLPTCIFLMSASICYDGLIMMQRLASCGTIGIVSYIMFQTCVFLFSSEAWSGIMVDYTYHTVLLKLALLFYLLSREYQPSTILSLCLTTKLRTGSILIWQFKFTSLIPLLVIGFPLWLPSMLSVSYVHHHCHE